jgi:GNAT superfamily N-acetyltransferase
LGGEENVKITIQRAIIGEADSLTAIQKQAFERLYNIYQDEGSPYLRGSDEIKRWLDGGVRDVYSIFANDTLCGGIAVRSNGNDEYYLHRIYVLLHLQGMGIARKAIELCEEFHPQAKIWTVDFPADQIASEKCYEASGYYDTGKLEKLSDTLSIAFYEKAINGIYEIRHTQLELAAAVIRKSFITVAHEFN